MENIESRIESIIFLSKEELTIEDLAKFYKIDKEKMKNIVYSLKEKRKDTGINIKIENEVIKLVSNALYGEDVKNFFNPELKIKKLTKSTMETVAIIAYKGPITKAEIEKIRGVGVEKTIANLVEKNLIYVSGKKQSIGAPNLYEVTDEFLSYLNVKNKNELPGYEEYEKTILLKVNSQGESIDEVEKLESIKEKLLKENKENIE